MIILPSDLSSFYDHFRDLTKMVYTYMRDYFGTF